MKILKVFNKFFIFGIADDKTIKKLKEFFKKLEKLGNHPKGALVITNKNKKRG